MKIFLFLVLNPGFFRHINTRIKASKVIDLKAWTTKLTRVKNILFRQSAPIRQTYIHSPSYGLSKWCLMSGKNYLSPF